MLEHCCLALGEAYPITQSDPPKRVSAPLAIRLGLPDINKLVAVGAVILSRNCAWLSVFAFHINLPSTVTRCQKEQRQDQQGGDPREPAHAPLLAVAVVGEV